MKEKVYKERQGYVKEAKKVYIEAHAQIFAHELYLNQKYHKAHNNSYMIVWNSCYNSQWVLTEKEEKSLIKRALEIAKEKYGYKTTNKEVKVCR